MNNPSSEKKRKAEDHATAAAMEQQPVGSSERNDHAAALEDDDYERMQEERRAYNRLSSARSRLRTKERIADLVALSERQAQQISQMEQVNLQLVEQLRVLTAEHQRLQQLQHLLQVRHSSAHHEQRQQPRQQQQQLHSSATNSNLQLLIDSLTNEATADRILRSQVAAIRPDGRQRQALPFRTIPEEAKDSHSWVANYTSNGTTAAAAAPSVPSGPLLPGDSILQAYNALLASLSRK
jgi:hypothetical protein